MMERVLYIGPYLIEVHLNTDNDFDYTIYKNGFLLDGGILENGEGLDYIPDSVMDELKSMIEN